MPRPAAARCWRDNNLSYDSVQTSYAGGGDGSSGGTGYAALNYRGGYGNANVGYSRSDGIKQLYHGLSGGVLAHAGRRHLKPADERHGRADQSPARTM